MAVKKTAAGASTAPTDQGTFGFEETLSRLETLVNDMEAGELSLEEALSAFETGIKLTRQCQQALQAAELKVQILSNPDADPVDMTLPDLANDEADT